MERGAIVALCLRPHIGLWGSSFVQLDPSGAYILSQRSSTPYLRPLLLSPKCHTPRLMCCSLFQKTDILEAVSLEPGMQVVLQVIG